MKGDTKTVIVWGPHQQSLYFMAMHIIEHLKIMPSVLVELYYIFSGANNIAVQGRIRKDLSLNVLAVTLAQCNSKSLTNHCQLNWGGGLTTHMHHVAIICIE